MVYRILRRISRIALALLVFIVAGITYPGAVLVAMVTRLTPSPSISSAATGALPWLHVEHPRAGTPFIADDRGRIVLLHGAIPQGLIDFYSTADTLRTDPPPFYPIDPAAYDGRCPDNSPYMPTPPLCKEDMSAMASLGFNSVRLPVSWSLLEPVRGRINQLYIDRVAQVVDWAKSAGMYVIIDMHQNAYSRYVGRSSPVPLPKGEVTNLRFNTGAPPWATLTDGFPSETYLGQRELNPAVMEASSNFWYDRNGIQDAYIAAVASLAKRFKSESAVAGYSLFNEPWPGWNLPPGFEDLLLFPFYRRAIDAITGARDGIPCWTGFYMPPPCGYPDLGIHDQNHLFFMEAGLLRHVTDFPTHLGLPVSSYPNLVLSIHTYTHVFTLDHLFKLDPKSYPWGQYDQTYALAQKEATALNAALFVAEFGNFRSDDAQILADELLEQEKHVVGFAFWTWKENCGGSSTWGLYDGIDCAQGTASTQSSGCLRANRERLLARVYPRASADPKLTYHYDSDTGAFTFQARGRAGDSPSGIYIPREVTGQVALFGAFSDESVATNSDGSRLVTAMPAGGAFSIAVSAAPLALTGCP